MKAKRLSERYSKEVIDAAFEVRYVPLPDEKRPQFEEGMRIFVELARKYKAKRVAEGTWNVDDADPLPTHREERANPGSPKPTVWRRGNGGGVEADDAGVSLALEEPEHSGWVEVHPLPTHREERANPGSPKPTVWRRGNGEWEKTVEEADE